MSQPQQRQAFPPDWHLGDTWVVEMTAQLKDLGTYTYYLQKTVTSFRVVEVPRAGVDTYTLQADCPEFGEAYRLTYSAATFAYLRLESVGERQRFLPEMVSALRNDGAGAFIMPPELSPVILDFPARPDPLNPRRPLEYGGAMEEKFGGTLVQTFSDAPGGSLITLAVRPSSASAMLQMVCSTVMTWHVGDPWWSTLERVTATSVTPTVKESGRLLSVGPPAPR